MKQLYYLDWLLMLLNLYSYYLIGNKNKVGFILGLIGCVLGVGLFTIFVFSLPMLIMYSVFGILNVTNYLKWQKLI